MDKTELVWLAEVTHPSHGRKVRVFRGEAQARAFAQRWRREWSGGAVATFRVEMLCLE